MSQTFHLVADVSGHGFGHLAQLAPVLDRIARRLPGLRLTIRSTIPPGRAGRFVDAPFGNGTPATDPCLPMLGPLEVDVEACLGAYRNLERDWDVVVAAERERLELLEPDLVISNIGPVVLAAAAAAGIPSVAFSSLNWLDALTPYAQGRMPRRVAKRMADAYASAQWFVRPTPHMPMTDFGNLKTVGPIARIGTDRRDTILARAGAPAGTRLVVVTFGGIRGESPDLVLPEMDNVIWVAPPGWTQRRADVLWRSDLDGVLEFHDILRSADAVVSKAGYGIVADAVFNACRLLYIERKGWGENSSFDDWLTQIGCARKVGRAVLEGGGLARELGALLDRPVPSPGDANGDEEAARIILREFVG